MLVRDAISDVLRVRVLHRKVLDPSILAAALEFA
jgi:hypothetical protein